LRYGPVRHGELAAAVFDQPRYDARVRDGKIEVRLADED